MKVNINIAIMVFTYLIFNVAPRKVRSRGGGDGDGDSCPQIGGEVHKLNDVAFTKALNSNEGDTPRVKNGCKNQEKFLDAYRTLSQKIKSYLQRSYIEGMQNLIRVKNKIESCYSEAYGYLKKFFTGKRLLRSHRNQRHENPLTPPQDLLDNYDSCIYEDDEELSFPVRSKRTLLENIFRYLGLSLLVAGITAALAVIIGIVVYTSFGIFALMISIMIFYLVITLGTSK